MNKDLGRLIIPDWRDQNYPISKKLAAAPREGVKYHNDNGWWGTQKGPHCVGYAFAHLIEDAPITHKEPGAFVDPVQIYLEAQTRDEWPGSGYDGTSARGACKYLQEIKIIESYHWGYSLQDLIDAVYHQPVPVGTSWYEDMFEPNSAHFVSVSGKYAGGHEWLVNGMNVKEKKFRAKNSWGRDWGDHGHFWITFDDMEKLIKDFGDICFVVEKNEKKK